MKNKIDILHEDDALIIVNKPPNFLTIPDRYAHHLPNLLDFLSKRCGKVFVVHRLDRETSGIICFAKTQEAHRHLNQQFQDRKAEKHYYALLEGNVHQETGRIDKPIAAHPSRSGRMIVSKSGKPSLTLYKVVERFRQFTLVEANIKTGRTHQIRVHFDAIGYPLAVDSVYGRRESFLLSEIKGRAYRRKDEREERPLISRSSLHARKLRLIHPDTEEWITIEADVPKDFRATLQQLRKWNVVE
ncbi:MAG: RluA family pseudouridine synthase [Bacteroidota bacterium]